MKKTYSVLFILGIIIVIFAFSFSFYNSSHTNRNIPINAVRIYMKNKNEGWIIDETGTLFSTRSGWKEYSEIRQFSWSTEGEAIPGITYIDGKLIVSGFLKENSIGIFSSADDGETWKESRVDYSDNDAGAYKLFLSFPDSEVGYLLYCGYPAAGLMSKTLYQTNNGGESFEKIADASLIAGYPTGMAFSKNQEGFITCMEHGNGDTYLYSTKDGGIQWDSQILDVGENNHVISAYQPKFIGQEGNLMLQISKDGNDNRTFAAYHTSDYGNTWLFDTEIDSIPSSCFDYISNGALYGSDGTEKLIMIQFHKNRE